ncbi:MAG TPA: SRPBCC domain-containing protein [Phycisphaerae bacterium]|nr:SRPBCC domain-containing protein [Phycisphaerae bacterium]
MANKIRSVSTVTINGTMEAVWREITKTDEVQKCMFNMQLHTSGLKPGAKIFMRSANGKHTGVAGEVIDFDPPHRYSHTFQFTNYDDPPCKVIYELKDIGGQVEFSLIIEDLVEGTKSAKQMVSGAKMITNTLKSIVETGKPSLGVRMLYVLFKLMAPLSPKRTRSENWQE